MALNSVMALFCAISPNLVAFTALYIKAVEDTQIHSRSEM